MANTVAIMQPYVFPYIGYISLVQASDCFVFYDDVNMIVRGWINRNQVLINGRCHKFAIPLTNASQNELICNVQAHHFQDFRDKFLKQIQLAYSRAPYFEMGFDYVQRVLRPNLSLISDIACFSIEEFCKIIGLSRQFLRSSETFESSRGTERADRLIAITQALGSASYVNSIGGTSLYDKNYFQEKGIKLSFVKPRLRPYNQIFTNEFVPGLSIIDVLMNNDIDSIIEMVSDYEVL